MMRWILNKIMVLLIVIVGKMSSQTTFNYQLFHDLNNNCVLDINEPLLYDLPVSMTVYYKNTFSIIDSVSAMTGCPGTLTLTNPYSPATNTVALKYLWGQYKVFSVNTGCNMFYNAPYNTTISLPIKQIDAMSDGFFYTPIGTFSGIKYNPVPICNNIGADSVSMYYEIMNLYTCNSTLASKTFSLYFDGLIFDQITVLSSSNYFSGTKSSVYLAYYPNQCFTYIKTVLPPNISSLGPHVLSVKTTNMYNSPLSALNFSCPINSVPCVSIKGKFYNDCVSNCNLDSGDGIVSGVVYGKVINSSGYNSTFYPDQNGNFSCFLPFAIGNYSVSNHSAAPTFTACSNSTVSIPSGSSTYTANYGYKINTYINPEVKILGIQGSTTLSATPKINIGVNPLQIYTCNTLTPNPGKLKLLLDKYLIFQSASAGTPAPDQINSGPNGDTLVWNINDFNSAPFNYSVKAAVSSSITTGLTFKLETYITPLVDSYLINNNCVFTGTYGASFDPNYKESYAVGIQPNGDIPMSTQHLYYTLHFQNVGTASARDVRILDTLDSNLDFSSLEILQSSFPVQMQLDAISKQALFYFQDIYLPDSTANEPASHGFVRFRIKLNSGLPINTSIKNRGYIYFDYNSPVITNITQNTLVTFSGVSENEINGTLKLLPNPVNERLFIESLEEIKWIEICNSMGQIVYQKEVKSMTAELSLVNLPASIYFVTLRLQSNRSVIKKIVKN